LLESALSVGLKTVSIAVSKSDKDELYEILKKNRAPEQTQGVDYSANNFNALSHLEIIANEIINEEILLQKVRKNRILNTFFYYKTVS